jgi:hypothetical protein
MIVPSCSTTCATTLLFGTASLLLQVARSAADSTSLETTVPVPHVSIYMLCRLDDEQDVVDAFESINPAKEMRN